jgi:hypothetical protein
MKLIMQIVPVDARCKLCEKVDTKMRRRAAEVEKISQLQKQGAKPALLSIGGSVTAIQDLDDGRPYWDLEPKSQSGGQDFDQVLHPCMEPCGDQVLHPCLETCGDQLNMRFKSRSTQITSYAQGAYME